MTAGTVTPIKERKPRTSKTLAQQIADKGAQVVKARERLQRQEAEYEALLQQARRQRVELDAVLS